MSTRDMSSILTTRLYVQHLNTKMLTFSLSCVLLWTYHAAARADYQDYLHQALDYWSLRALNLIRDTKLGIERIMDSMTDSKSGSGQTTAGQTPSYSIYPL